MRVVGSYLFVLFIWLVYSEKDLTSYDDEIGKNTEMTPGLSVQRYRILKATGDCTEFQYKGKGMDFNNFKSLEECENHKKKSKDDVLEAVKAVIASTLTNPQSAPTSVCEGVVTKKYYLKKTVGADSTATYSCEMFDYKGCGGGKNFFHTEVECEEAKAAIVDRVANRFSCGIHPLITNSGDNTFKVVADMSIRKCLYAVVKTDENVGVFESIEQCVNICLSRASDMNPKCNSRISQIKCGRKVTQKYTYNKLSKYCHVYETEDCKHPENANLFDSYGDCVSSCPTSITLNTKIESYQKVRDICSLSRSDGVGYLHLVRYYFDRHISMCMPFIFRGVGGNENRFLSMDECMGVCFGTSTQIQKEPLIIDPTAEEPTITVDAVPTNNQQASEVSANNVNSGPNGNIDGQTVEQDGSQGSNTQ